jgi:hypothetical protein
MKKVLLCLVLTIMTAYAVKAQSRTVTGQVTSSDEPEGIPGASISIKGTTTGTVTDIDGRYSINVPGESAVLVYSFVGFRPVEMTVGNQSTIDVTMEPDVRVLSEVVVTAQNIERNEKSLGYTVQSV